jgi:predicted nuclease with TOPRIM domain
VRCSYTLIALLISAAVSLAPIARGEDASAPDQLKRMYDDTLSQLKDTQQRKTQLAADNEQLKAKVAELQQQLAAQQAKMTELEKQRSELAEREFYLQSHYTVWQQFLHQFPLLEMKWKSFINTDLATPRTDQPTLLEPYWPAIAQA